MLTVGRNRSGINDNEVCDVNPFGVIATQVAYNEEEEWLNQLIKYLQANFLYMQEFCRERFCPSFLSRHWREPIVVWMTVTIRHTLAGTRTAIG